MKIKIKYVEKSNKEDGIENDSFISFYLFNFIRVKRLKIRKNIDEKTKVSNKVLETFFLILKQILRSLDKKAIFDASMGVIKSIKVIKLNLNLGLNLANPIINAYAIAGINSLLPALFLNNPQNFNLKNIQYNTYISKKVINLEVDSIIHVSIVKNIISIIKIIFIVLKGGIKNGNKASNRISNDNVNDVYRKYGRC